MNVAGVIGIDDADDIGMIEPGRGLRLAAEAAHGVVVLEAIFADHFDGHRLIVAAARAFINIPMPPRPSSPCRMKSGRVGSKWDGDRRGRSPADRMRVGSCSSGSAGVGPGFGVKASVSKRLREGW